MNKILIEREFSMDNIVEKVKEEMIQISDESMKEADLWTVRSLNHPPGERSRS